MRKTGLGLDLGEQRRSGLGCAHAICQVAYGRNLIVESRANQARVHTIVERTRERLDVPGTATLAGVVAAPPKRIRRLVRQSCQPCSGSISGC